MTRRAEPVGTRLARAAWLGANRLLYAGPFRALIFRRSAQDAHDDMLRWLRRADGLRGLDPFLAVAGYLAFRAEAVTVGGVRLPHPLILAAGLVKGDGFESEEAALEAVRAGRNIIPGWRVIPRLVGPVEFGSFTRWPRLGNPGTVVWRDVAARSSQNRIGLRNPGARAAAAFLAGRRDQLPPVYGINVAVSPGVEDPDEQAREVAEALAAFIERDVHPDWFTLNLSCPNTEDDPGSHQTATGASQVCEAARAVVGEIPLWVKLGPTLAAEQYRALISVFAAAGVRAVVATNTLPAPSPGDPALSAGVGGARLHARAVEVVGLLAAERARYGYPVDVIGCGGVLDGTSYRAFTRMGAGAAQYWTALIYRGPLAAALILDEAQQERDETRV